MTEIRRAPQPAVTEAAVRPALPRRVLVGAIVAPLAWLGLTAAGGGLAHAPIMWTVLVTCASIFGAASLATYVPGPGAGRTPVWGCAPCAVIAAASLPIAAVMLHSNPGEISSAGLAAFVTGLGLVQRLRDPKACPTRPRA